MPSSSDSSYNSPYNSPYHAPHRTPGDGPFRDTIRQMQALTECSRRYDPPRTAEQNAQFLREFEAVNADFASFVGLAPPGRYGLMAGATPYGLPRPSGIRVPSAPAHPPASLQQGQPAVQYQPYVYPAELETPAITVSANAAVAAATCSAGVVLASSACSILTALGIVVYFLA